MINQSYKGDKGIYQIGRELGKGGEGSVYEVVNDDKLVLKLYSEVLSLPKVRKLKMMAASASGQLDGYTAWVKDVVIDQKGNPCGFTMKKLVDFYPLHTLFGPMDRKKIFPDKGYNFLVHVARNLATAFHTCHANGHIIGDVNEGNILVNSQGMIMLIDCDSFQIKDGNSYFFCEVGIPRYTSPELLSKATFNQVVRTKNTDNFSLAVILFQLLFLGRHPFAGINTSNIDIDEELAIKNHWFAYSDRTKDRKLLPPKDSYQLSYIRQSLRDMFHYSFESIENRPSAAEWVRELELFKTDLTTCKKSKIHFYPDWLSQCPWCQFAEQRNILYFLDDNYLDQLGTLNNIDSFVNGFKVATFNFPPLQFPLAHQEKIVARPIDPIYKSYKWNHRASLAIPVIAGICMISISPWMIGIGLFVSFILNSNLPWIKKIQEELKTRQKNFERIKGQLESAIKEYNSPKEIASYNQKSTILLQTIAKIKRLPTDLQNQKKDIEEKLYDRQLHHFLSNFDIRNFDIPSFGATRKLSLYNAGIRTAADVSKLRSLKIQGIGPSFEARLRYWQQQMSSKFIYHPDITVLRNEYNRIGSQIEQTKKHLETEIRNQFQTMENIRVGVISRQNQIKKYVEEAINEYFQAYQDYEAFKVVAK